MTKVMKAKYHILVVNQMGRVGIIRELLDIEYGKLYWAESDMQEILTISFFLFSHLFRSFHGDLLVYKHKYGAAYIEYLNTSPKQKKVKETFEHCRSNHGS